MSELEEKKRIYFNLEEFKDFFSSLDLNCRFNEESGNIESIEGILLKGKITTGSEKLENV